MKIKSEFVIFGKVPGGVMEQLLVCENAGLKNREHAEKICTLLEEKHGCTDCRVFEFDGSTPDFAGAVNL